VLAAQVGDRNAGLLLLQNPDDLLFRKAAALHALILVMGQSELQPGLSPRGNVKGFRAIGGRWHKGFLGRSKLLEGCFPLIMTDASQQARCIL
jgi:hypothetical protein